MNFLRIPFIGGPQISVSYIHGPNILQYLLQINPQEI